MVGVRLFRIATLSAVATAFTFTFAGCQGGHPDDSAAVYKALDQNDLPSVQVDQDRGKGIITLRGMVGDQGRKDHAQQLAQQAAPGYTIQNDLRVDNSSILGAANPNAKPPEVEQMAHPPVSEKGQSAPKPKHGRHQ